MENGQTITMEQKMTRQASIAMLMSCVSGSLFAFGFKTAENECTIKCLDSKDESC